MPVTGQNSIKMNSLGIYALYNKPFSCTTKQKVTAILFPVVFSHQHLMELQEDGVKERCCDINGESQLTAVLKMIQLLSEVAFILSER